MSSIQFYRTFFKGEWRWRLKGGNNRIIASSSEGFKNHNDCVKNAKLTRDLLASHLKPYNNE